MASVNKSKLAEAAQKLLAKGQIDKALKEYEKVLQADPGDASTRLKVGDLKLRLGQKEPAVHEYHRVAEKFTQEGFYSKAVAVLKRIISVEPQFLEAHLELASLNQKLGLLSEVVHHYQLAANIHDRRGEKRQAIDILKKVADVGPPNLERRIKVAELYYREGLKDSGFEQFEAAVAEIDPLSGELTAVTRRMWKACPEDHRLGRKYAELCLARADAKSAAEALEEISGRVRDPELVGLLAEAKAALDLAGEAKTLFEEAADLYRTRGNTAGSQAMAARAVEIASAALDISAETEDPSAPAPRADEPIIAEDRPAPPPRPSDMTEEQHLEAALSEADVYQKYGKLDRAVTILEELASRLPSRHEAPLRLRAIFEASEDWMSVAIQCRRLARVAEGRGDPERAARFEEQALEAELRAQGSGEEPGAASPDSVAAPARERPVIASRPAEPAPIVAPRVPAHPVAPAPVEAEAIGVPPSPPLAASDGGEEELGDIELVIEGEDEPVIPAEFAPPAGSALEGGTGAPAMDELELCLDEEPPSAPDRIPSPAESDARDDEPDLILDDVFDEAPAARDAEPPRPGRAATEEEFGDIEIDLEEAEGAPEEGSPKASGEAPGEPRERSVEEELILREISAEGAELREAEEIIPSAARRSLEGTPDPVRRIDLDAQEPSVPGASGEADEVVLLDTFGDEEMDGGSDFGALGESLLEEREPTCGAATADVGPAPARAPEAIGDGAFELDLDLQFDEPAPVVDPPRPPASPHPPPLPGDSGFDLRAELDLDGASCGSVANATRELSELVSELQQQEESVPSAEDAQTHYDLGIAYKEMGLLDDAIRELKIAAREPGRRVECLAVLGICYCEQGKPEEALGMFEQCLALGGRTGKGAAGILYEMGLVHEEAGNAAEALECYRRVAEIDSDYRETRARMARLRAAGPEGPPEPTRGGRSKRISYL